MGALHSGHESLVARCREENQLVAVSIFVNPTQFNDPQDLEHYPRTLDRDLALLESLGVDEVLAPPAREFYPHGYRYRVEGVADPVMEAAYRPGFLQGVLTIVMKLLHVARARRGLLRRKGFSTTARRQRNGGGILHPDGDRCLPYRSGGIRIGGELTQRPSDARGDAIRRLSSTMRLWKARARTTLEECSNRKASPSSTSKSTGGRRLAAVFLEGVRLIDNVAVR